MDYVHEVCIRCVDRHCCRGLCKEMNDYFAKKNNKSFKMDSKSGKIRQKQETGNKKKTKRYK